MVLICGTIFDLSSAEFLQIFVQKFALLKTALFNSVIH